MEKMYYLAYGSNLNLNQMAYRCPDAKAVGSVILKDFRIVYKGFQDNFAYLTIEECKGSKVPLGLFEVSEEDIEALDIYEGYPTSYQKYYIPVRHGLKKVNALIYIMNPYSDYHLPSVKYLTTCYEGYNDFGFDFSILRQALDDTIENHPDYSKIKELFK